jgi:hypothetical protein
MKGAEGRGLRPYRTSTTPALRLMLGKLKVVTKVGAKSVRKHSDGDTKFTKVLIYNQSSDKWSEGMFESLNFSGTF